MPKLIDELRTAYRERNAAYQLATNFLDSRASYQKIFDDFESRTTRFNNVPDVLDDRKRGECSYILQFLLSYERLPVEDVAIGEAPDFAISLGGRRIGVELSKLFVPHPRENKSTKRRGSIRREQERIQDLIVERAVVLHAKHGGEPFRLLACFADTDFQARDVETAAKFLADIAPVTVGNGHFLDRRSPSGSQWPQWLSAVYVSPRPEVVQEIARWSASHGGTVWAGEEIALAAIREKERKLTEYQKYPCNEYWLLLIITEQAASSFIDLEDQYRVYVSAFENVFVFWPNREGSKRILRLNCHRPR
jgi:hypothetical protein